MRTRSRLGITEIVRRISLVAALTVFAFEAAAQDIRPARIVVPWPAGGSADIVGRLLADHLAPVFKRPFLVENRPGASGMVGSAAVAAAPADGSTFLISGIPSHVIAPAMSPTPTFDPLNGFSHIAFIGGSPIVFVAHPSLNIGNFDELIWFAKSQQTPVAYVSPGVGSLGHLLAELMADRNSIRVLHVPYRGGTQAVTDLVGGHVKLGAMTWSAAQTHIASGALIPIAVTASERIPGFESIPTLRELGQNELTTTTWWSFSAPPGMEPSLIEEMNAAVERTLTLPPVAQRLARDTIETRAMTSAQFVNFLRSEIERWSPVAKRIANTQDRR